MGTWRVPSDVLAGSRFALSPKAEVVGALGALTRPRSPEQRAFGAAHAAAFRAWLSERPAAADLVAASFRDARPGLAGWMADYLCLPPEGPDPTFEEELDHLRRLSDDELRADLRETTRADLAPVLLRPGLRDVAVDVVSWLWTHTLETDWGRRERILRADIVSRTAQLARHGWAVVLRDLGRDREWVGDGQLRINRYDLPTRTLPVGSRLVFVPTHTDGSWVGWRATATPSTTRSRGGSPRRRRQHRRARAAPRRQPGRRAHPARGPAQHLPGGDAQRPRARVGRQPPEGAARGGRGDPATIGP